MTGGSEKPKVLVIDDEARIRELVVRALDGRNVVAVATPEEARNHMPAAVALLDLRLGESDGMKLLDEFRADFPAVPIIIMTAFATIESAVEAVKRGAHDYVTKPFSSLDDLRLRVDRVLEAVRLRSDNEALRSLLLEQDRFEEMIGGSDAMRKIYALLSSVAENDATVLITGESGTGKELVARAIHRRSHRSRKPFLEINCAAIPDTLLESELFGYEKGAFTGAYRTKKGLFESAPGGTILLDEIGEMPIGLQVKLLRTIEEKTFTRLGAVSPIKIDVRILSATNKDLREAVRAGTFREDLYFRLAVMHLDLPPLRDREGDVIRLLAALLPDVPVAPEAMKILSEYSWPGNVRELKNFVERVKGSNLKKIELTDVETLLSVGKKSLRTSTREGKEGSLPELVESYEKDMILSALKDANGSRTEAAARLGLSRQALQYKLEKFRIDY